MTITMRLTLLLLILFMCGCVHQAVKCQPPVPPDDSAMAEPHYEDQITQTLCKATPDPNCR